MQKETFEVSWQHRLNEAANLSAIRFESVHLWTPSVPAYRLVAAVFSSKFSSSCFCLNRSVFCASAHRVLWILFVPGITFKVLVWQHLRVMAHAKVVCFYETVLQWTFTFLTIDIVNCCPPASLCSASSCESCIGFCFVLLFVFQDFDARFLRSESVAWVCVEDFWRTMCSHFPSRASMHARSKWRIYLYER